MSRRINALGNNQIPLDMPTLATTTSLLARAEIYLRTRLNELEPSMTADQSDAGEAAARRLYQVSKALERCQCEQRLRVSEPLRARGALLEASLDNWTNTSRRRAALALLERVGSTRPSTPEEVLYQFRSAGKSVIRTVRSAKSLKDLKKSSSQEKGPGGLSNSEWQRDKERVINIAMETALIKAISSNCDDFNAHNHGMDLYTAFQRGKEQTAFGFQDARKVVKEAFKSNANGLEDDPLPSFRAKIDAEVAVNQLIGTLCLPSVEMTTPNRRIADSMLRKMRSRDDLSTKLIKQMQGDTSINLSSDECGVYKGHEYSGKEFFGEICHVELDQHGQVSSILVKQQTPPNADSTSTSEPKTEKQFFFRLAGDKVKFVIRDGDKRSPAITSVRLNEGLSC
jgi:hypothetical protein